MTYKLLIWTFNNSSLSTPTLPDQQLLSIWSLKDQRCPSAFGRMRPLSGRIFAIRRRDSWNPAFAEPSKIANFLSPKGLFQAQHVPKRGHLGLCPRPRNGELTTLPRPPGQLGRSNTRPHLILKSCRVWKSVGLTLMCRDWDVTWRHSTTGLH